MTTNTTATNKMSKPAKPRQTAAQRREEAEKARQAAVAEFELKKPQIWQELWMKAMRLALLRSEVPGFSREYSWWFEDFSLDAKDQSFRVQNIYGVVSEATLAFDEVETLQDEFTLIYERLQDFEEEQERKRLEAIETERRYQEALGKLNDQDKQVLGLSPKRN